MSISPRARANQNTGPVVRVRRPRRRLDGTSHSARPKKKGAKSNGIGLWGLFCCANGEGKAEQIQGKAGSVPEVHL